MRVLGIDVGSSSIKAVELDSAFGRYEVHEYHEVTFDLNAGPRDAVERLIHQLPKAPDRVVVALRSKDVTFRNLQLPTRDKKAIQAAVGFELDDEIPFPIDSAAYDYSVLSQSKQGTFVHVAATLKSHLAATLSFWGEGGVDPDVATTEAWALKTYLNRTLSAPEQEAPVLIVQIGHERTVVYAHWRGAPVLTRELDWGGRDLTLAICQSYQIPLEEAEQAKLDHGFVIPPTQRHEMTAEQTAFSDALMTPIQELLADLRQSMLTCKNITHQNVGSVLLSGGTSRLPGLARVIEEHLHVSTKPMQSLSRISTSGISYSEQTDATFLLAASLALCQIGSDRGLAINFRKGEFAKLGRSREINLSNLRKPLMAGAAITACLITSLFVQSSVYRTRQKEVDAQLEKSIRSFFGQLSGSAVGTYMRNTSGLKTAVNKELGKQRELGKLYGANPKSPLDFLKDLSATTPKDVVVDMIQFQVGASTAAPYQPSEEPQANLTFLVSNPQIAEKLANIMGGKLGNLQRGKMEEIPSPEGGAARWKITFSGKPNESSFGDANGK